MAGRSSEVGGASRPITSKKAPPITGSVVAAATTRS
jgi:hypothetical protein